MTTFEVAVASIKGARQAAQQARSAQRANRRTAAASNVRKVGPAVRRFTLTIGALGAFTYAAATWHEWAGLVVGGLCALYLEQSMSDD